MLCENYTEFKQGAILKLVKNDKNIKIIDNKDYVPLTLHVLIIVQAIPPTNLEALSIISYIGCGVSMACLLLTIIFFCAQW